MNLDVKATGNLKVALDSSLQAQIFFNFFLEIRDNVLTISPRLSLQPNFPFSMGKWKFACKDRQLYPLPRLFLQCKDREFPWNFDVVPYQHPKYYFCGIFWLGNDFENRPKHSMVQAASSRAVHSLAKTISFIIMNIWFWLSITDINTVIMVFP